MSAWKLTIRHGSEVARERFEDLDDALRELQARAEAVRAEGNLRPVSMLREFAPEEQIHARLEISGAGLIRPPTAGVDVHGDGSLVPFEGSVRRRALELRRGESAFDAIHAALEGRQ